MAPTPTINELPSELISAIASRLDDQTLVNFSKVSTHVFARICDDHAPHWRDLFVQHFDAAENRSNAVLKRLYTYRRAILRKGADFKNGYHGMEPECLEVLRDLIIESYLAIDHSPNHHGKAMSRNINSIETFCKHFNLLDRLMLSRYAAHKTTSLLQVVQVCLAHMFLDNERRHYSYGIPTSQKIVYQDARNEPLFNGVHRSTVNMRWLLNVINLFKNYMTHEEWHSIHSAFGALRETQRPGAWSEKLHVQGTFPIGRRWKGAYTYLDVLELQPVRSRSPDSGRDIVEDLFNDDGDDFSELTVGYPESATSLPWPNVLEEILCAKSHPSTEHLRSFETGSDIADTSHGASPTTRMRRPTSSASRKTRSKAKKINKDTALDELDTVGSNIRSVPIGAESLAFKAIGMESDPFLAAGYLNPLPRQNGIGGWQRFTMAKYFSPEPAFEDEQAGLSIHRQFERLKEILANDQEFATLLHDVGPSEDLWAYEGVVLPGGKMILGRWWAPEERDPAAGIGLGTAPDDSAPILYSGPFIYWCVDGDMEEDCI